MIKSVNLWKVINQPLYYSFKSKDYFSVLNDLGFNSVSIYKEVSLKFIEEAKKNNFRVFSLLPEVLNPSEKYNFLTDIKGDNFNQICFSESEKWCSNNLRRLDSSLIDDYIITDIPWYLSLLSSHSPRKNRHPPFYATYTKDFLLRNNIKIPNVINFEKEWKWWKLEIEDKLFDLYMLRFLPLLEELKNKWFPITVRDDKVENLSSKPIIRNCKKYIDKYNVNVILMNASKQPNLIKRFMNNNLIIGGTEGALGLVDEKNGRKLIEKGYNGFVTNEHQLFNNRHPKWSEIKKEINYIEENYE